MNLSLTKLPQIFFYAILLIICIPTIFALLPSGYFYTHDGAYHLIRLFHFYNELQRGQFPVRWASDLGFGYGYPVFNYFYPLLYYIGSLIHFLGFSFEDSLKLILAASTIFSAWAMYWWLKGHFQTLPAFIGTVIYIYTPYRFSLMYVNGHFGAVLELFIIPVILGLINRILIKQNYKLLPILSIFLAMYFTAHNITTLFFLPVIVGYVLILIFTQKITKKQISLLLVFSLLGVGLAAFFIFPAVFEFKFVQSSLGNPVGYQDHWTTLNQLIYSKWGFGFSGKGILSEQSTQLGVAQQLLFLVGLITLIFSINIMRFEVEKSREFFLSAFMILMTIVCIFLMLEQSNFLWQNIKILQEIQFPWRLLSVPMLAIPFISGWVLQRWPKSWLILLIIFILFVNNRNYLRTWETKRYSVADYQKDTYQFYGSTDVAWESKPIWAGEIAQDHEAGKIETSHQAKITNISDIDSGKRQFIIESENPQKVIVNYLFFPFWKVLVDGKDATINYTHPNGLISFDVSTGKHEVVMYVGSTDLENMANLISLASFAFVLTGAIYLYTLKNDYA